MRAEFLFLAMLVGCGSKDDSDTGSARVPVEPFSFALLTDLHVGEGRADFGTPGWDDADGEAGALEETDRAAVAKVNEAAARDGIAFAVVLGDLTDSAERSEMALAHALLDELAVPWVPLLGNHDAWPYAWDGEGGTFTEADGPIGDAWFLDEFASAYDAFDAFATLERAPVPVWDPVDAIDCAFVNFSFNFNGFHFIALDLTSRPPADGGEPGVGPSADLMDFTGGTFDWFGEQLASYGPAGGTRDGQDTLVLAHHPAVPIADMSLDATESARVASLIADEGFSSRIPAWFAGHLHLDLPLDLDGIPVVVTPATKDGATVRLVTVTDDGVDFSTFL